MHSSGPRPKSHCGSPAKTSAPTRLGAPQLKRAVPAEELPDGRQVTLSCWKFGSVGPVFWLKNATANRPSGSTTGSEPWSRLHALAGCDGSKKSPKKQRGLFPLISSGVDHVKPWSVDIEPKIADEQNAGFLGSPPRQVFLKSNTVHVTYTLSLFGLLVK